MYRVFIGETLGEQGFGRGTVSLDTSRHAAIFGQTGTGKSTLLKRLMLYPVLEGRGLFAVDPHTSLIEGFLDILPAYRTEDVIYFDPTSDRPIGLNPLKDRTQLAVDQTIEIMSEIYGENSWGGRSAIVARNFGYALIEAETKPTLIHLRLMFFDKEYRQWVFGKASSNPAKEFGKKFEKDWSERLQEDSAAAPMNKIDALTACDQLRHIFGQPDGLNFSQAIKDKKIILWALNKGAIGEENAALLGSVGLRMALNAGLSRSFWNEIFPIFYDEFHTFTKGSAYKEVFSETRKYGFSFTLADQNISQLPEGADSSIFANVGNLVVFRTSADDARKFAPELDLEHTRPLVKLQNNTMFVRSIENGLVKIRLTDALPPVDAKSRNYRLANSSAVKDRSQSFYGTDRHKVEQSLTQLGKRGGEKNERKRSNRRSKTKADGIRGGKTDGNRPPVGGTPEVPAR